MGCILACLRFKGNDKRRNKAHLKSSPIPSKAKEPLLSEDQFVPVFISEGSTCEQVADLKFEDHRDDDVFDTEFKDQVKFLKSCGAILETPAELRKASEKLITQPLNKEISSCDSSCIPDRVIKKLVWEEQEDQVEKHDCTLHSASKRESESGSSASAILDASQPCDETKGSDYFATAKHDPENESASNTASLVPGTPKLVLVEEPENSSFERHISAGFNIGMHQVEKHGCTLYSASQRESRSDSAPAILDASQQCDETKGSAYSATAKHDPENESASKTASRVPGTPKLVLDEEPEDSSFERRSSAGINVGMHQVEKHDCNLYSASQRESESDSAPAILDTSQQCDETKGSAYSATAKHDPEIELSAELTAMVDVSHNGAQIQVHGSKFVCLESASQNPGSESEIASRVSDDSPSQDGTQIQSLVGNNSPYPTPLQLTDEMGTPCTVYPSTRETPRKNARVRNQYVYPVLNPVDDPAQLKMQPTQVASSSNNQNDKRSPDREEFDKENYSSVKKLRSLTPLSNSRWKVTSSPQVEVLSLSQWLKHPQPDNKKKYSRLERTPDVERPIFGVVAMHWNEEDPSKVSPKLWGGNGIPNTTTKYKEDQKVSWHATPFEERLDKALSDDKLFPRRKDISRNLVAFNDEGERE